MMTEQNELFSMRSSKGTQIVTLRFTESEYLAISDECKIRQMTISDTIRSILAERLGDKFHKYETWKEK